MITNNSIPTKEEQYPLLFEYGYSKFKDIQTILVQELPENAPSVLKKKKKLYYFISLYILKKGLLPRSVDVVLE